MSDDDKQTFDKIKIAAALEGRVARQAATYSRYINYRSKVTISQIKNDFF